MASLSCLKTHSTSDLVLLLEPEGDDELNMAVEAWIGA